MNNIFQSLTKGREDFALFEFDVLAENGRLTQSGRDLVVDLIFQGKEIKEIRKIVLDEIEKIKKEKNK